MKTESAKYLAVSSIFLMIGFSAESQVNWFSRAALPNLLTECGSVVLNGKVYIIGGLEPGGISTAKVHVYDPVNNTWSTSAPLPMAMHHLACAVAYSKIYVLGGYTSNPFQPVTYTYEYDPVLNNWVSKAPVPTVRGASAAAEMNGKIYVIGGAGYNLLQSNNINEVYDPVMNLWETKAPMPTERDHHAVISVDSLIYSIGGRNFSFNIGSTRVVEAYSPYSDTWYPMDSLIWSRSGFSLCNYYGKIYAIGGEWFTPGQSGLRAQIELYDPKINNWEYFTTMSTTRHGLGVGVAGDTIYTISGGVQAGFSYSDVNEAFVPVKSIGIEHISETAAMFELKQNYPNPFNPSTKIKFSLTETGYVTLRIFDIRGSVITTLLSASMKKGTYEFSYTIDDRPSGVYFCMLEAGVNKQTKKMIFTK
jgi:Kelch motif/Secretion system C-terminal sorting domain